MKEVLGAELDSPKVKVDVDGFEPKVVVPNIDGVFDDPEPNRLDWVVDADVEDEKEKPLDAPNVAGDDAADENGELDWLLKL